VIFCSSYFLGGWSQEMEAKACHMLSLQRCGEGCFPWGDNPKSLRFTRTLLVPQQLPVKNSEHRSAIFVSSLQFRHQSQFSKRDAMQTPQSQNWFMREDA